MRTSHYILFFNVLIYVISSCTSTKNLVYFKEGDETVTNLMMREPIIEVGDIISVEITSSDPEVAKPFNQSDFARQGNQSATYNSGVPISYGYLVSTDSTVLLPIIGKVKVAGLSKEIAVDKIQEVLTDYLQAPSVALRILNFKVTVLGEVENPGTFSIPNERITLIEALGIARDLKITGKRSNVLVIRTENNIKTEHRVDLTSKNLFSSPAYYLKQNDIVYVEPNKRSKYDASLLRSTGGVIVSATSLVISTLVLIFNK